VGEVAKKKNGGLMTATTFSAGVKKRVKKGEGITSDRNCFRK